MVLGDAQPSPHKEHPNMMLVWPRRMKEHFEGNPGYWLLGIVIAAFSAGVGTNEYARRLLDSGTAPDSAMLAQAAFADTFAQLTLKTRRDLQFQQSYVIPTVTMLIRLEKQAGASPLELRADQRIVYSLQAARSIAMNSGLFTEQFESRNASLARLPGADREGPLVDESTTSTVRWDVRFGMIPGAVRSVVTGVRRAYDGPLQPNRTSHAHRVFPDARRLEPSEDEFCYPAGTDLIGEITILVESSSLRFRKPQGAAAYIISERESTVRPVEAELSIAAVGNANRSVVYARFPRLGLRDEACLVVAWEQ